MLRNKKIIGFLAGFTMLLFIACYKDKTVIFDTGEEITRPVSFASDIVPIFNRYCNTSGCHNSGGQVPDLSADKAFTSLSNGGYLNLNSPENSELYLELTDNMPPGGPGNPSNLNQLVIAWMKQGAQNN